MKNQLTNRTAGGLFRLLSGISFKSIGGELFLPILELIAALSEMVEKSDELRKAVLKQFDIEVDATGSISFPDLQTANQVNKHIDDIDSKLVSLENVKLLTKDHVKQLSDENPKLHGRDLLDMMKHLVISGPASETSK